MEEWAGWWAVVATGSNKTDSSAYTVPVTNALGTPVWTCAQNDANSWHTTSNIYLTSSTSTDVWSCSQDIQSTDSQYRSLMKRCNVSNVASWCIVWNNMKVETYMVKVGSYVHIPAIQYSDMHVVFVYKVTRETEFLIHLLTFAGRSKADSSPEICYLCCRSAFQYAVIVNRLWVL